MSEKNELFDLLPSLWQERLLDQRESLRDIDHRLNGRITNPERARIFSAFELDPMDVKVVLIGQDPYPTASHAQGLAFSVPSSVERFPPTLRNIFVEYSEDLKLPIPKSGDLSSWRESGVLLLNSILSCNPGESLSHKDIGWQEFTHQVVKSLSTPEVVGILWGRTAAEYRGEFDPSMVIESPHPSPLSAYRGFFGSRPFSRANNLLKAKGLGPVNWTLQNV